MYATTVFAILSLALSVSAEPKPVLATGSSGPVTLPLYHASGRPDPNAGSRAGWWLRRKSLLTRRKYARHLDATAHAHLKRDIVDFERGLAGQEVITTWERDTMYSAKLEVGTPAQTFELQLDTGSSDMYLYSSACANCPGGPKFDYTKSSTYHAGDPSDELQYGIGYAKGIWANDTVSIAGATVFDQTFQATNDTDDSYANTTISGLIGLAWPALASVAMPLWINLMDQWDDKRFAFALARVSLTDGTNPWEDGAAPGGVVTLGGVDDSLYTGEIIYHNLTGNDYWRVDMESVNINGQVLSTGKNLSAIIDTGSTLLTGPTEQVKAFYSHIPGSSPTSYEGTDGFYQFPCANANQLDVQLTFNGVSYPIDYDDMIFRPVTNGTADIEDGMCFGAMFGYDFDNINWIIGDTFLKNVVSVFQYDPPAVGFATPVTHRAGWYGANKKGAGRKTHKGPHRQDNHW